MGQIGGKKGEETNHLYKFPGAPEKRKGM